MSQDAAWQQGQEQEQYTRFLGGFIKEQLEQQGYCIFGFTESCDDMFRMLQQHVPYPVLVTYMEDGHPPEHTFLVLKDVHGMLRPHIRGT
jgi:hypothetical protein